MFSPFIFSRSTSWLDGSWEKKKNKKKGWRGIRRGFGGVKLFFFAFPWNNAHPPHPAASRWRNNASRRRKGIYNDIFERAGVGYLNFIETANNNDFHPRVERRKSKPSPGYDCSPPARARDASVPRWREKKQKKKKNQLFISRRLNREPQTWWMVKGSKRTFPFSVRDGSRSMETANPSLTESKTVKTIHFFDISLLSPPIY